MPRYYEGARGPVIFGLELSLVVVLETKYGDMEHTPVIVSERSPLRHFGLHAIDEAVSSRAHIGEGGSYGAPIVAEQLLLSGLVIQIYVWVNAYEPPVFDRPCADEVGGDHLAGANVAIHVKADPRAELGVEVSLPTEWQGALPVPPPCSLPSVE